MFAYSVRRLLISLPVLAVFSFLTYLILYQAGDPKARLRQIPGLRAEDFQRLVEQQGLNKGALAGYWDWLTGFLHGDWGTSISNKGAGAYELIMARVPATLELVGGAVILSILIAAPLGVYSAVRRYSGVDFTATAFAYVGFAIPTFLLGLFLQLFAIWIKDNGWAIIPFVLGLILILASVFRLRKGRGPVITLVVGVAIAALSLIFWDQAGGDGNLLFYTAQRYSPDQYGNWFSSDHLRHLALPIITLSVIQIANWSRFQRSATIEVLSQDYLRTARAKGLTSRRVIGKHGLRNALLPLITLLALELGGVFGGAVVTETVFGWPGLGRLLNDSAQNGDIPVAMGLVMMSAIAIVVFNLLADLMYSVADPRIRLG